MLEARREFFPTVLVANRVLWVNPNVQTPYFLREGESSELGVFLVNPQYRLGMGVLAVDHCHGRSGLLPQIPMTDTRGITYHDTDLKGVGFIRPSLQEPIYITPIEIRNEEATSGLWRMEKAFRERNITEDLIGVGMRTYRLAAIIELLEIALPNGLIITVVNAKRRGMMHADETPVIGLRVYRNRERVENPDSDKRECLQKAKERIANELNANLSWLEYVKWFARTLGTNLAQVHNHGYWHGFLNDHNVTLGAEIVDFGYGNYADRKRLEDHSIGARVTLMVDDVDCARKTLAHLMWDVIEIQDKTITGNFGVIMEDAYSHTSSRHCVPR